MGRECGGYAPEGRDDASKTLTPIAIRPRPMSVIKYAPPVDIPGDQQERRYFHRFCEKIAAEICGSFDPAFWTDKVLQLCHQDAPIRYATIALGALAMSLEFSPFPTRLSLSGFPQIHHRQLDEHHRYALRQYSRAIASLRASLSDGRRHLRTSLTSYVLFMSFEALQGNYDGSLTHLRGGSRLLAEWRMARRSQASRLSQDSLSEVQDGLVDDLGRMFARLDVQGLFVPPPFPMPELPWEAWGSARPSTAQLRLENRGTSCSVAFPNSTANHSPSPKKILKTSQQPLGCKGTTTTWRSLFNGVPPSKSHTLKK